SGRAGDGTRGASSDGSPGPGNGTSVPSTERNETLALRVGNNSLRPRKSDPPTFASPRNAEGATSRGFVAPEPGGTPRGTSDDTSARRFRPLVTCVTIQHAIQC